MHAHPGHWLSARGTADWFRLWHPPSWTRVEQDGNLSLCSPDGRGVLTLMSFWRSDWRSVPLDRAVDLRPAFAGARRLRRLKPLDLPWPSLAWDAEIPRPEPKQPWWRRLLGRRKWQRRRFWVVRHEAVSLLAFFLPSDPPDPEVETVATMILGTLEFADPPADPPAVFAERVLELARRQFPGYTSELQSEFRLRLGRSSVNLFNFYRAYTGAPQRFDEILRGGLQAVIDAEAWSARENEPALEQVRRRVMPMLYPQDVWRSNLPGFVGRPWIADLTVLYVVDEPQAYWYIRRDLLPRWGLSEQELHELALRNLDEHFENQPMEFTLAGSDEGPRVLMPNRPDAYNTSRLLSESFHRHLRELLGRECAVGLPGRDFFVAFSLGSREAEQHVRRKVAEDFQRIDHPLTDRLLLVSADGVSEFVAP